MKVCPNQETDKRINLFGPEENPFKKLYLFVLILNIEDVQSHQRNLIQKSHNLFIKFLFSGLYKIQFYFKLNALCPIFTEYFCLCFILFLVYSLILCLHLHFLYQIKLYSVSIYLWRICLDGVENIYQDQEHCDQQGHAARDYLQQNI